MNAPSPRWSPAWDRLERSEMRRTARRIGERDTTTRPRPDQPAGADLLPQIRHVVVLMMENHSYDNYLGMLGRGDGLVCGPGGKPEAANPRGNGGTVRAYHLPSTCQQEETPDQSWHGSHVQWGEGRCDGFVRSVEEMAPGRDAAVPMGYWTGEDLPFYYGLARTFPLADRWFSSCLGPTFPNRRFLIAGTAHGLVDDLPFDLADYPAAGTVFDLLSEHGISWANYHHYSPWNAVLKRSLGGGGGLNMLRRLASVGRWYQPMIRAVRGNKSFTADVYPLGLARSRLHLHSTARFFADARDGTLPSFSIVDPDFGAYSEENPQDIRLGEAFAAEVIRAVMQGKGWPHTVLIWLYDEHGGYYDHVPPPEAVPPDDVEGRCLHSMPTWLQPCLKPLLGDTISRAQAEDAGPRRYDRYGFRVPAVVVSPYARPDYVSSQVFDHTSVLKLLGEKWNLPPLTRRDAAAVAPLDMLDLGGPPAFLQPPDLPAPSLGWGAWTPARERR